LQNNTFKQTKNFRQNTKKRIFAS